ncbi:hypothetical protein CAEBREN_32512 [Caenorhabditis brenneri]|uniref:Serpentine receptor class gamma n=1 Tax=Caenorhabditis brenneri TaxID=135651 RepID=G0N8N7_CAEBE|nr:hypothetical protein CAEBREN_32512 [Caenorhabditis brenneri]
MISSSMIVMLISFLLQSLACLSIGTVFEDDKCAELPIKFILLCIHRYFEAFSLASQLLFTIERVLSIQFSRSHGSHYFKVFFVFGIFFINFFSSSYVYSNVIIGGYGVHWLIIFQFAVISNFPVRF